LTLLIVGGSDAGTMAALRARELDPALELIMVVADRYPNFSVRGLPFYVSREVDDWRTLAHRTVADIEGHGIELLLDHTAMSLEPHAKKVIVRDRTGNERALH
jgi:NADPH-dependent 2,4-dienoyl-CoA reductase/sulfur reductase-like enzyme